MNGTPLKKGMFTQEMVWIGDGFNSAKDQVGRRVSIDGRAGVVTAATDLFITVKFDKWWSWKWLLRKLWWCNNSALVDDEHLWFCRRPWFHRGPHRDAEGRKWPQ